MSTAQQPSLLQAWWIFTKERFAPLEHLLMVFFLVLGNTSVACLLLDKEWLWQSFLLSFAVAMSFFFRLRCFDEIKDYEVDLEVNPTRPLARGVLTIPQVKTMFMLLTVFELVVVWFAGVPALICHAIAVAYSYLMYKEFFIGKYLSPHLTTYAVSHTFVSILVGYSVIAQNTHLGFEQFPDYVLIFGVVNWALFNLFEFARKTYAPEEERENVDTYSSLFRPLGAGLLSLSQVAFALAVLWLVSANHGQINLLSGIGLYGHMGAASLVALATVLYIAQPSTKTAGLFRGVCGGYLILFFMLLSYQGLFF